LLRDIGLVNMFESSPFLFSGKEWIDRYYGEGREDDENFQKFLDESEIAKNKMIQGTLKYMESKGKEIEIEEVNRILRRMAQKIVQLYVTFS
jgi:phage terminase Nu1 subunit (DNA packaging protein)